MTCVQPTTRENKRYGCFEMIHATSDAIPAERPRAGRLAKKNTKCRVSTIPAAEKTALLSRDSLRGLLVFSNDTLETGGNVTDVKAK